DLPTPICRGERGEWHHGAGRVTYIQPVQVFGIHPERSVGLNVNALDAAVGVEEVVDILRAPRNRERLIDGAQVDAERARLLAIDVDLVHRAVGYAVRAHQREVRIL